MASSAWRLPLARVTTVSLLLVALLVGTAEAGTQVVRSGSRSSRAVALTFDDGWGRSACSSIAATLRRHHVKGTFFINGIHLKAAPAIWRRILRGMPVGNHTRSHRNLTAQSDVIVRRQIVTNEQVHWRTLGRPMLRVLRPPYGAWDARVRRLAGSLGYDRIILWNVDTRDWTRTATTGSVIARATGARPGSIVLMHCARGITARALPTIIRHYKARGIRMVGLDELLGI